MKNKEASNKTQEGTGGQKPLEDPGPKPEAKAPPPEPKKEEKKVEEVLNFVEQMPEFADGQAALMKYLSENIKYPTMARDNDISGTVYVAFVVEPDGRISNVRSLRGPGGGLQEEAVRVVSAMPNWKAGKQNGRAVRVNFTLPVRFRLE